MKIIFSPSAIASLQEIVEFLEAKWTIKEYNVLENDILKFKESLVSKIISFPKINQSSEIHYSIILKNK